MCVIIDLDHFYFENAHCLLLDSLVFKYLRPWHDMGEIRNIGDRLTSDVVVRLRTEDGRDDWIYCHSQVLVEKSKYFADRLSESWPTCQILDSRGCVEVYCQERDFDHHVNVLRLFYVIKDGSVDDLWNGVKNALGILQVAVGLGCPQIITATVNYLEAVPWEESEEEEILRVIPRLGPEVEPILARLQPVETASMVSIFISAMRFATSSPPPSLSDLKSSTQEQLEYMITEDDDAPLLTADVETKSVVNECVRQLFSRFNNLLEALLCEPMDSVCEGDAVRQLHSSLADLGWACQMLMKMEIMREFVNSWVDGSDKIVKVVMQIGELETKMKTIEVTAKVLEAIGFGTVILPTAKRLHMVKVWLPFARIIKPLIDSIAMEDEDSLAFKKDDEAWLSLESAFVSLISALPSEDQAQILTEWFDNENIRYPDLTDAFEIWCYRSKATKRRLAELSSDNRMAN